MALINDTRPADTRLLQRDSGECLLMRDYIAQGGRRQAIFAHFGGAR